MKKANHKQSANFLIEHEIEDLVRDRTRILITDLLEEEINDYLNSKSHLIKGKHPLIIRNGQHKERKICTQIGDISLRVPRTRHRLGEKENFRSQLIPNYLRFFPGAKQNLLKIFFDSIDDSMQLEKYLKLLIDAPVNVISKSKRKHYYQCCSDEILQLNQRNLHEEIITTLCLGTFCLCNESRKDRAVSLLIVGGLDKSKKFHFYHIEKGNPSSANDWKAILARLNVRGLSKINNFLYNEDDSAIKTAVQAYSTSAGLPTTTLSLPQKQTGQKQLKKINTAIEKVSKAAPKSTAVAKKVTKTAPKSAAVAKKVAKAAPKSAAVAKKVAKAAPKSAAVAKKVAKAAPKSAAVAKKVTKIEPKSAAIAKKVTKAAPKSAAVAKKVAKPAIKALSPQKKAKKY